MKGYLQRLVRTVTNPAESVHPRAGSMFGAVQRGDFNVSQTEELPLAAGAGQSSELMSPASAQYFRPSVSTQHSPPASGHNSETSESQRTYIAAGFTQLERSADQGASIDERIVFEPVISYIERSSPDSADATQPEMRPAQKSEKALPPRGHRSLAGAEAIIKPGNTRRFAVGSSLAPQAKTDARAVGSHVGGDQRTDEIQIHIGRIEVTAVQAATLSAPVTRPRKSAPSLDEYLRRRDRRTS